MSGAAEHLAGIAAMLVGAIAISSLALALGARPTEKKQDLTGPAVAIEVSREKKKPRERPVRRERPKPSPRASAKAPPPAFAGAMAGLDLDLGSFAGIKTAGDPKQLITGGPAAKDLVMTEDAVDELPKVRRQVAAKFPPRARARALTGKVALRILIDEGGQVRQVEVTSASPEGVFEDAASEAVRQWEFEPATYRGKPVRMWFELAMRFDLE